MKNAKRMLSFVLAVVLVAVMCPVTPAQAAETMSADVCPCCGKKFSDIKWTSVSGIFAKYTDLSKEGHYKIGKAFTENKEFSISGKVTIDFGGYKLQAKSGSRGFTVKSGGTLTLINTGGSNGRLEGHNTSSEGVAIKVEAGGTLNILSGRVVGKSTSYNGGAIYNAGTVNMAGGKIDSGKANDKLGGNIYNTGTLNIYDGTVEGGSAKQGGNIYNTGALNIYGGAVDGGVTTTSGGDGGNIFNAGTVTMKDGSITVGSVTGDDGYGGNIYNSGTFTLEGGTVSDGTAQDHGGNFFCSAGASLFIKGGTVSGGTVTGGETSGGTAFNAYGGNIYMTKKESTLNIYGGTITSGKAEGENGGGNIALFSGVQAYMYGGTIENGVGTKGPNVCLSGYATLADDSKQYSGLYILGGTITANEKEDLFKGSVHNVLSMYNCRYNGTMDISTFLADCCCTVKDDKGVTVWNAGYRDGICTDCLYAQAMAAGLVTPVSGGHNYEKTDKNTYTCTGCGKTAAFETVAATVNGELFDNISSALSAASAGSTLVLMDDATVEADVVVNGYTLNLNGYTLTAPVFTAAVAGDVIDSSRSSTGKLVSNNVTLAENNSYLPVTMDDGIHFSEVGFTQWVEPVDMNTTKVKFYFTQRSQETILDNAIQAGNTEVDVQICLTWTDAEGNAKEKTVVFGQELIQKYAEKWNGRVFVATVNGTANISDLQMAYQVTSTATSGVMLSAKTIKSAGYINENLTWEQINSYPIKTTDMTVEEMRQLCVDFMEFNKTFLWTPDTTVNYIRNSSGSKDSMKQGTVYGGLPYVGVASGNPYRMMDYINPETGLVDMKKAIPALEDSDSVTMADMKYFGNQCSICVYWAWGRVMNSTNYKWTSSAVPYNDFVILGDVVIPSGTKSWSTTYGTDECVAENGEQVMFGGYAQLQKADGMVYYTTAGHLIMAYSDPVVVYNDDGTINGDESYIYIIDQAQTWVKGTNESGDTYQYKSSVNAKKTFTQLFNSNYIPFTFKEFLGTDPIEVTEVSLVNGSTTYVSGTVSETDCSFQVTTTKNKLSWSNIFASSIKSNYGVVDAYVIVYDNYGNEVYKHAVRTATAGNMALNMEETGEMVTVWETKALQSGRTYSAEIVVQLATGERPTIWNGQLTYDK